MERNYDEIIAEMLIQLDMHNQELTRHSQELIKQSAESTRIHQEVRTDIEKMSSQFVEQLVHSATILDRIIRKNDLKV